MQNHESVSKNKVVLILGVSMRSGTNHLYDLLGKHPQCSLASGAYEDYILSESAYLDKFIRTLWSFWKRYTSSSVTEELLQSKAEAFLHEILLSQVPEINTDKLVVSKTPSTKGLEQLPVLLQSTKVLFLVRDGRSVAYSYEKSFNKSFFNAILHWQHGAINIIEFRRKYKSYYDSNCLLIRYEDLCLDPASELKRCFDFLCIDHTYDFNYALDSNVIGSSDIIDKAAGIHWNPMPRANDFSPIERYKKWAIWKQKFATVLLRKELKQFEYDATTSQITSLLISFLDSTYNLWKIKGFLSLGSLKRALKSQLLKQ